MAFQLMMDHCIDGMILRQQNLSAKFARDGCQGILLVLDEARKLNWRLKNARMKTIRLPRLFLVVMVAGGLLLVREIVLEGILLVDDVDS
jgi:hypothetical protein